MLLIEYVGHIGLRSLTDGHLGRHLEYFKTLNDARVASVGFIMYNASTTRINKEKNFKIKFQVIQVFHWTIMVHYKFFLGVPNYKANRIQIPFSHVFQQIIFISAVEAHPRTISFLCQSSPVVFDKMLFCYPDIYIRTSVTSPSCFFNRLYQFEQSW